MTILQTWMRKHEKTDSDVARVIGRHRSQISRIRRGETTASEPTAKKLAALTGVSWWKFMEANTTKRKG